MKKVIIAFNEHKKKVMGCCLGKAIGGTLGGPWEGQRGSLDLTFYNPLPDRMLPDEYGVFSRNLKAKLFPLAKNHRKTTRPVET